VLGILEPLITAAAQKQLDGHLRRLTALVEKAPATSGATP
jgi:hypothetical protein